MEGYGKATIDRSRFTRKDLANVPLSPQEVEMLADKYNASSTKRWKYGIEIVEEGSKIKSDQLAARKKRQPRAVLGPDEDASKSDWPELEGIVNVANNTGMPSARSSVRSRPGTGRKGSKPAVSKKRCDCCQASFAKDSLKNCITMKSVLDLQKKWGIKRHETRYKKGSYMYSKAYLCVFCLQFFQASPDAAKRAAEVNDETSRGVEAVIQREHLSTVSANQKRLNDLREYNVAVGKPAFMSSISDGLGAWLAVDGDADAEKNKCCRTRREYESWWEVDLEDNYPIKEIFLLCRKESSSYQMAPFWIMVCPTRQRGASLEDARKNSSYTKMVDRGVDELTWELPKDAMGACVRVQCEGIKSLQLAEVAIVKGGLSASKVAKLKPGASEPNPSPAKSVGSNPRSSRRSDGGASVTSRITESPSMAAPSVRTSLRESGDFNLLMTMRPDTAPAGTLAGPARLKSQPDDKLVATIGASTRVAPEVRKVIRLKKDSVEDLFWKTAVRYDIREQQSDAMKQAHELMGPKMIAALWEFYQSLRPVLGPQKPGDRRQLTMPLTPSDRNADLLEIEAFALCAALRRLAQQILALDPQEEKRMEARAAEQARKSKKKQVIPKKTFAQIVAKGLPHMDVQKTQAYAEAVKRITKAEEGVHLPILWDQLLLLFRCFALDGGEDAIAVALAVHVPKPQPDVASLGYTKPRSFIPPKPDVPEDAWDLAILGSHKTTHLNPVTREDLKPMGKLLRSNRYLNDIEHLRDPRRIMKDMPMSAYETALEVNRQFEERHERQRALTSALPDMESEMELMKMCGLCHFNFTSSAMSDIPVTVHHLSLLLRKMKRQDDTKKYEIRLASTALAKYQRVPVCMFCSQFFDPTSIDGLTQDKFHRPPSDMVGYIQFYDDRFPDRFSGESFKPPVSPLKTGAEGGEVMLPIGERPSLVSSATGESTILARMQRTQEQLDKRDRLEAQLLADLPMDMPMVQYIPRRVPMDTIIMNEEADAEAAEAAAEADAEAKKKAAFEETMQRLGMADLSPDAEAAEGEGE